MFDFVLEPAHLLQRPHHLGFGLVELGGQRSILGFQFSDLNFETDDLGCQIGAVLLFLSQLPLEVVRADDLRAVGLLGDAAAQDEGSDQDKGTGYFSDQTQ